ncbi:MAG TPA: hypothetical protein VM032_16815 [Vicinamibacterales bacterium]|nr:hypothetical protein [Vicinamibacterales bacterium]
MSELAPELPRSNGRFADPRLPDVVTLGPQRHVAIVWQRRQISDDVDGVLVEHGEEQ